MLNLFKSWGFEQNRRVYPFPTPKSRLVELLGAKPINWNWKNRPLAEDRTSGQKSWTITFLQCIFCWWRYHCDTGLCQQGYRLITKLDKLGIDAKGKIVIARYGGSWIFKPKVAYEHGAIGCLIYSDPVDDGYTKVMSILRVRSDPKMVYSVVLSWTCPYTLAIPNTGRRCY